MSGAAGDTAGHATSKPSLRPSELLMIAMRFTMEAAIVGALAYWGATAGHSTPLKLLLAVGAPAIGFGFWGAVDFRRAGRLAEPLRLLQELAVSGVAGLALYLAGHHAAGAGLGALSVAYHALVYARGERLLKPVT